jgi:hypothetical protein
MDNIKSFCKAREYLVERMSPLIDTFLTGIWDPLIKHTLVRDTIKIIECELVGRFPELSRQLIPRVKFRIQDASEMVEVGIQNYLNQEKELAYLGSAGIGGEVFDFYYRIAYDPRFDYVFTAKYGHGYEDYYSGSKTAEAEYYLGTVTPLALAYAMALEDGII